MEHRFDLNGRAITVRLRKMESYRQNPGNTNQGTPRGDAAIRSSQAASGFHRGVAVAANDVVIAGNHSYQAATEEGVVEAWVEIESDGHVGVATKRADWDTQASPEAIRAAISDNRTQQLNFSPDLAALEESLESLTFAKTELPRTLYTESELDDILQGLGSESESETESASGDHEQAEHSLVKETRLPGRYPLVVVLEEEHHKEWERIKEFLDIKRDQNAFEKILPLLSDYYS